VWKHNKNNSLTTPERLPRIAVPGDQGEKFLLCFSTTYSNPGTIFAAPFSL
jgi:hypothetical protein